MKKKAFICVILSAMLAIGIMAVAACGEPSKTVTGIEVTAPTKTEYIVNETFSVEGGYLTVTYDDGTTAQIELNAEGVELSEPKMDTAGKKTITVRYGGERTSFIIYVNMQTYTVTLDYNYIGGKTDSVEAEMNETFDEPTAPVRGGYGFRGWFVDQTCTMAYDFDKPVEAPFTLYARWLKDGPSHNFTFDFNRTGIKNRTVLLEYEANAKAVKYAQDPTRTGYSFDGWYTAAEGGTAYDFNAALTSDTVVYAHWTKTVSGSNEWVFEAENIDLSKMTGPGLSGTVSKGGMLYTVTDKGASNNRYLGNLYKMASSTTATFYIDSDVAATDVKFVARLSMEARNYTFNKDNYIIKVNGKEIDYADIVFTGVSAPNNTSAEILAFRDFDIAANLSFVKGQNVIEFITNNTDALAGTTITSAAPLIDCIKLTSAAVLSWDGGKDLPMKW